MDIFLERVRIIQNILKIYKDDIHVLNAIKNGEDLSHFLKCLPVFYPSEYNFLLNKKMNTFEDIISIFCIIRSKLEEKKKNYDLYKDYVYYFLAGKINDSDLSYEVCFGNVYNAVEEDGKIDYYPYLNHLGIDYINLVNSCQRKKLIKEGDFDKLPFPGLRD